MFKKVDPDFKFAEVERFADTTAGAFPPHFVRKEKPFESPSRAKQFARSPLRFHFVQAAEAERFELSKVLPLPPFQDGALDRYATPPIH